MVEVFSSIKILIFEGIKLICVFLKCRVFFGLRLQYVHLACSPTPTSNRQRYSLVSLAFDKSNSELRVGRSICYFNHPTVLSKEASPNAWSRHQERSGTKRRTNLNAITASTQIQSTTFFSIVHHGRRRIRKEGSQGL